MYIFAHKDEPVDGLRWVETCISMKDIEFSCQTLYCPTNARKL